VDAGQDRGCGNGGDQAAMRHAHGAVTLARWALGGDKTEVGRAQLTNTTKFPIIHYFLQSTNQFKFLKCEKGNSILPKFSKLFIVEDKFKRNIFPFGNKFKFPTEFELKIPGPKQS
jgi:hypothetical protein